MFRLNAKVEAILSILYKNCWFQVTAAETTEMK